MAKSETTQQLEQAIINHAREHKDNELVCHEVSVSKDTQGSKHKFVDALRYNRHTNEFTCYEIKISKEDFASDNGHNFVGDLNYYVIPSDLNDFVTRKVAHSHVGVLIFEDGKLVETKEPLKISKTRKEKYFLLYALARAINREKIKKEN